MNTRRRTVLTFVLVLAVGSCKSDGSGPTGPEAPSPGTLSVQLTTPNANDGGVMFTVSGGTVTSVTSTAYTVFTAQPSSSIRKVVVVGDVTSGVLVTLSIPDASKSSQYTVVLEQAAARDTYGQQDLSGYSLQVVP